MKTLTRVAFLTVGLLAAATASAHGWHDDDRGWDRHERHEREWREQAWREHQWRERERWEYEHRRWRPAYAPVYAPAYGYREYYPMPAPVPVYSRPAITIGIPPIVIPIR
ncbi:hypothetical protein [Niveibacterium sp.]|uniref:hypothetical protein n=1 Tax=Niveibacterium sp. TaxID=2017444 RepID=UPI0035B34D88